MFFNFLTFSLFLVAIFSLLFIKKSMIIICKLHFSLYHCISNNFKKKLFIVFK